MFRRILVPIDFTPKAREAAGVAAGMARESDGEVILLHVIETVEEASFEELERIHAETERMAREKMNALIAEIGETDVPIEQQICFSKRSKDQEIVEFAKGNSIDLIVLASHKIEPEEPGRGVGTVSYRVGILAPCAIILVK